MTGMKGPAIFLAQFLGDTAPYDTLDGLARWAGELGYTGVQIPCDPRLIDLAQAAESKAYCDDLRGRLSSTLRSELSPRHVPDGIEAVPDIPRTLNGKKLEVPVKRILEGVELDQAVSTGAVADPEAFEPFLAFARKE